MAWSQQYEDETRRILQEPLWRRLVEEGLVSGPYSHEAWDKHGAAAMESFNELLIDHRRPMVAADLGCCEALVAVDS